MDLQTVDAYRFGKSKRQIKKTSAYLVDEIEQRHNHAMVLIYQNFIYAFSCENVLITVYRNDKYRCRKKHMIFDQFYFVCILPPKNGVPLLRDPVFCIGDPDLN